MRKFQYPTTLVSFIFGALGVMTGGCGGGCVEPVADGETAGETTTGETTTGETTTGETGETGDTGDMFEASVSLETVAEGLTAPLDLAPAPDGTGRLFVVEQTGKIRVIGPDGALLTEPFLDISDKLVALETGYDERGLLGLAFHPDYANNGRFFVYYSAPLRSEAPQDFDHTSHVSEFHVSADNADVADPESETLMLEVDQPQTNHNAGQLRFGPEGHLYISLGDGGGANDVGLGHVEDWYQTNEGGNGQDIQENLLGSILRIDVDAEAPYGIPTDNPFVGEEGVAGEIWAYGLRNPYRMSFDAGGEHELFVGDVGQDLWEEVDIVQGGANYGWNVKEGTHCFSTADPMQSLDSCPDTGSLDEPLVDPIIEYPNANQDGGLGVAVIGGYVYRGQALDGFEGRYIFGDYSAELGQQGNGTLFVGSRPEAPEQPWVMQELSISNDDDGRVGAFVRGFGQDQDGELYLLVSDAQDPNGATGKVYRLAPAG